MTDVMGQKIVDTGWSGDHFEGGDDHRPCGYVRLEDGTRLNVLPDDAEIVETIIRFRGDSRAVCRFVELAMEVGGTFHIESSPHGAVEINEALAERIKQIEQVIKNRDEDRKRDRERHA